MDDISFILNDIKYNFRVASIIRHNDKVLLHKNINDPFYTIPGGRIKILEDSISALKREFREEINAKINIKKMIAVVENFFNYENKKYHEIMFIYESDFTDINFYNTEVIKGIENKGNLQFTWKKKEDLDSLDIRPINIKKLLYSETEDFLHILDNNKSF